MRSFAFLLALSSVALGPSLARAEGPPSKPAAPSAPQANLPGIARIHIVSSDPRVQLRHRLGAAADDVLCLAPCDLIVNGRKGDEFSFGGSGLTRSAPFLLFDKQGDLTAKVHPGRFAYLKSGIASLAVGAASTLVGGSALGVGLSDSSSASGSGNGATAFGAVALGTGAVAAVVGIVLLVVGRTTYELHPPMIAAPAVTPPGTVPPPLLRPTPRPAPSSHDEPLPGSEDARPRPISPPPSAPGPTLIVPPPPAPSVDEALPADEDPCQTAIELDRQAAVAAEPTKTPLLRTAAARHRECDLSRRRHPKAD